MSHLLEEKPQEGTMVEDVTLRAAATRSTELATLSTLGSIKAHPKVIMYCLLMTIGPLIYGYDSIVLGVSTAMPAFLETYGAELNGMYVLPSVWIALWNALTQLGAMVGSVFNGPLSDRFGRKTSMVVGATISCISIAIMYISDRPETVDGRRGTFLAGKLILGFSLGIFQVTSATYISEIAPPRIRGPLLSTFSFFLILGQLIAVGIVFGQIVIPGPQSYRVSFASQWAFAGFALVVGLIIPESPAHLLRRQNFEGAKKACARLHKSIYVEATLATLQLTLEHERLVNEASLGTTFRECFKGTNWRRIRLVLYANVIGQCLGVTFVANSTYFLISAGMSPTSSVTVLAIALGVCLPANMCSWYLMNTVGRRLMMIICTIFVGILWLTVGIAGFYQSSTTALWYVGVMINMVLFFFHLGVGGAAPVVAGETPSIRLRTKSQSIGFFAAGFSSWAFNFFVPYMFNVDEGNWGAKTGLFFAGLCAIGAIVLWIELPEMKNRTYAEIDEMFEERVPTKKFATYKTEMQAAARESEMS